MIKNKKIEIEDAQDTRFWFHSTELGYGCWIDNKTLKDIIWEKSIKIDSGFKPKTK